MTETCPTLMARVIISLMEYLWTGPFVLLSAPAGLILGFSLPPCGLGVSSSSRCAMMSQVTSSPFNNQHPVCTHTHKKKCGKSNANSDLNGEKRVEVRWRSLYWCEGGNGRICNWGWRGEGYIKAIKGVFRLVIVLLSSLVFFHQNKKKKNLDLSLLLLLPLFDPGPSSR